MGNKDTEVTIELEPPSDLYRAVTIKGSTATTDGRNQTHDKLMFWDVCDGDVRFEFHIEGDWHLDKSVTLTFIGRIFETAGPSDGIDSERDYSIFYDISRTNRILGGYECRKR